MKRLRTWSFITWASYTALALSFGACSQSPLHEPGEQAPAGSVGLALKLDPAIAINTVHYEITGSAYSTSGDIDVSGSAAIHKVIPQVPSGSYQLELTASSVDGAVSCGGSAQFEVQAHTTTSVSVRLQCRVPQQTGSVVINGELNVCPSIDGLTAEPDQLLVGGTSQLIALASDSDSGPDDLVYQWTTSSGSLSDPSAPDPIFTATEAGTATVSLTVSDGDCSDSWSLQIRSNVAPTGPSVAFTATPKAKASTIVPGSFSFESADSHSSFACSLDGAAFAACESPLVIPRLSEGQHTFSVKAQSRRGLDGPVSEFSWSVRRPNIVTLIADDLGFSDIEPYGGEIETPNLRALAEEGRILANHHVGTVCAITRSMLISGTDHHWVGEGTMGAPSDERAGLPGYEGYLNDSSLSVAQLLKDAGYHTYIAGKWHLGSRIVGGTSGVGKTADQWGFERSFNVLGGGVSNHFVHEPASSTAFTQDGVYVRPGQPGAPSGFDTDIYTDQLISNVDSNLSDGKPFFVWAAYTEPHWPLQAPDEWVDKYKGKYDQGYAPVIAARLARLRQTGLISDVEAAGAGLPESLTRSPATAANATANAKYVSAVNSAADGFVDYGQGPVVKNWESLSPLEQKTQSRYMEIYAAMVSHLDYNIGRLLQHLKDIGEYDNTFIIFHSDNGAESWPVNSGADPKANDENYASEAIFPTLGRDNGAASARNIKYGIRWSEVSATPLAQFKGFQGEGGVSAPAIVHLPGQSQAQSVIHQFTHVTDDTATFLDLADVTPPSAPAPASVDPKTGVDSNRGKVVYKGRYVYPVTGQSLLPALSQGAPSPIHLEPFGDESYGRAFIRSADGQWKARWTEPPYGAVDGHWQLFSMREDRAEVNDLSALHPEIAADLVQQWKAYMTRVGGVEPLRPLGYY